MVIPKEETERKKYVRSMFNSIASKYDFLNHFLSGGTDFIWRRKAISLLKEFQPRQMDGQAKKILDVACGTGDFSFAAMQLFPSEIIGVDIADEMLAIGKEKIAKRNLQNIIRFENGEAESLKFSDAYFDAAIVSFGVRNFSNLEKGLSEMRRVLKTNGVLCILEFSKPKIFPFKQLYFFYFKHILPFLGKRISKSEKAYDYLPQTVMNFPEGENFISILKNVGFKDVEEKRLTFGVSTVYLARK
ncbi:MAG: bifunctional demethylmenaquinone methyltransferase/2-methoxy-6-polyprenyl-1,4-benzoquinol methylase UbiE [Ignavibacteriales bacterium]|nr:bifunctional demethylmenaquinone methyltransferase/2-methoxy-6-polyprenyl-1,4-benzoquinol methylase UbiE [Ignavibacteriales bacterium]